MLWLVELVGLIRLRLCNGSSAERRPSALTSKIRWWQLPRKALMTPCAAKYAMVGWLVGWLVGCGWLVLVGLLVYWLVGWLVQLVGWVGWAAEGRVDVELGWRGGW